jgi:hypothetical protein
MGNLFSSSLTEPATVAVPHGVVELPDEEVLLVAGFGNRLLVDFVAFAHQEGTRRIAVVSTSELCSQVNEFAAVCPRAGVSTTGWISRWADGRDVTAVIFLGQRLNEPDRSVLETIRQMDVEKRVRRICLVSHFAVHFGDRQTAAIETEALNRLDPLVAPTVIFRPGPVLSPRSRATAYLRALAWCAPLVPTRFRAGCVEGNRLFEAVQHALSRSHSRRGAVYTVLGPNRPWQQWLQAHKGAGWLQRGLRAIAATLAQLGVGQLAGLLVSLLLRLVPALRQWSYDTLTPTSVRELLALYNPYNFRHVKIVGYNNGVVHFGHRYPEKTVVSAIRCGRVARLHGWTATFDAGIVLRRAIDFLREAGKEFHVLPNYSYISVGTSFFVPIHGSASDFSAMADTIEKVLLYDPGEDSFVAASRGDPAFRHYLYNPDGEIVLLRLRFRVKEKSSYYLERSQLENPTSDEILAILRDERASNVEIRKPRAASPAIDVYRYFTEPPAGENALAFPKDSLGKVWDRLEENPLTSCLFHGLTRWLAYHVELFFTADEFAVFWQTHGTLPLAKIQLRHIRRDGFPHSPFQHHDCISADLFMLKKHRLAFDAYVKEKFRAIQFNPGKHSL